MQPRSNRDKERQEKERQKYNVLLQFEQGGHPLSCSTIHYGQVQKRHWTHLTDARESATWSVTLGRDRTC